MGQLRYFDICCDFVTFVWEIRNFHFCIRDSAIMHSIFLARSPTY